MVDFSKSRGNLLKKLHSLEKDTSVSDKLTIINNQEDSLHGLNIDQEVMVKGMIEYLSGKTVLDYYLVQGSGGTGKSFSVRRALQGIDPQQIIAAAPSHSAKNVLKNFLGKNYTVTTIASLLGKKISFDKKGKQILVKIPRITPPIINKQIILLDEGSMIDDETAEEILSHIKTGKKLLVVLGDYCQLPPVGQESDSLFFENISVELTIPMRFTGPIYSITTYIREEIIKVRKGLIPSLYILNIKTNRISDIDESGSGYIFLNSINSVITAAIKRFKMGKGTQYVRVLAYRNKTIDRINMRIREGLFGNNPDQFEVGEMLINTGGYSLDRGKKYKSIITNGELFEIKRSRDVIGPYDIPCKQLYFKGRKFDVPILTVSYAGRKTYDDTLDRLVRSASNNHSLWGDVYKFKESFSYFNYSYSTSIHKAQGSSISHVFIIEEDIYATRSTSVKEKLQSMYVAVSRAAFRVYIYNKSVKPDNSFLNVDYLKKDIDDE